MDDDGPDGDGYGADGSADEAGDADDSAEYVPGDFLLDGATQDEQWWNDWMNYERV